jgi:L-amino acid N-acyltransferase YncA
MIIRDATPADLVEITRIYADSVLNGVASYELVAPDEAEMERRMSAIRDSGYPYLVAEGGDDGLLGYAYASAFRTRPAYRWLVEDSIYLAPEARGRGVGRALLEALIERCETLGFRQMVAVIGGAHPASIAVHQKAGFVQHRDDFRVGPQAWALARHGFHAAAAGRGQGHRSRRGELSGYTFQRMTIRN